MNINDLKAKAHWLRRELFEMAMRQKKGHIPSSFSCAEILVTLYLDCLLPRAIKEYFLCSGTSDFMVNPDSSHRADKGEKVRVATGMLENENQEAKSFYRTC